MSDLHADEELYEAWMEYDFCRKLTLQQYGGGFGKTILVFYPEGYNCLPRDGGLDDQPARIIEYFMAFQAGEMDAAHEKIEGLNDDD